MEHRKVNMTSAEISLLWGSYISDSMSLRMLQAFLVTVEDGDVRRVLEEAVDGCKEDQSMVAGLFTGEGIPVPQGFTEAEVYMDSPRLYSDTTLLFFLQNRTMIVQNINSMSSSMVSREDVRAFYTQRLAKFDRMNNRQIHTMLEKGVYVRPPFVSYPERVDFVKKESFLNGLFNKRSLLAQEAANLFLNMQTNTLGAAVLKGYAQTAQDEEVRRYLQRGYELSTKFTALLAEELSEAEVPFTTNGHLEVTDSTTPPFSERLMLAHVDALNTAGITNFGMGLASAFRRDLGSMYSKCIAETLTYASDGAQLVIEKGWLEQPPLV